MYIHIDSSNWTQWVLKGGHEVWREIPSPGEKLREVGENMHWRIWSRQKGLLVWKFERISNNKKVYLQAIVVYTPASGDKAEVGRSLWIQTQLCLHITLFCANNGYIVRFSYPHSPHSPPSLVSSSTSQPRLQVPIQTCWRPKLNPRCSLSEKINEWPKLWPATVILINRFQVCWPQDHCLSCSPLLHSQLSPS